MKNKSISDLVKAVDRYLKRDASTSPGTRILSRLFEVVYFTSLKTEEGRAIQIRVALVDPANPDPDRPPRPTADRWKIMRLGRSIPLTVPNLVKLAKAADPWSSCLAVYYDATGEPFIWGLVDQVVHFSTNLVHEKPHSYAPPGLVQLIVLGTADLSAYRGHEFIARLAQDNLVRKQIDVFWSGPISDHLDKAISPYIQSVWRDILRRERAPYVASHVEEFRRSHSRDPEIAETWIGTLCRILISIQRYRHGGALLVTRSKADLAFKYQIRYSRLRSALIHYWSARLREWMGDEEIEPFIAGGRGDSLPVGEYLSKVVAGYEAEEYTDEITGCVRFISSLACVDGLVLATPDLVIRGFGVEILTKKDMDAVYLAPSPQAHVKGLKKIDPNHYGTRHRSMMRYCFAHPGSFGFVISQDGDIRAMTRLKGKLVMWENLKTLDFRKNYKPPAPSPATSSKVTDPNGNPAQQTPIS